MLSLSQFSKNLFPIFKLLKRTGMVLEVVHDNVVYNVYIQQTPKKPKLTRAKKLRKTAVDVQQISTAVCEKCNGFTVAGVCMNRACPNS